MSEPTEVTSAKEAIAASIAEDRAATLAGLEANADKEGATEPQGEAQETAEEAVEPGEAEAPEPKEEAKAEKKESEKKDPDEAAISKRIEVINRAEQRMKAAVAKERQAFEAKQAEWEPRAKAAEAFETLKAKAKVDPVAALRAIGVEPSEHLARQIYQLTPEVLAKHPEYAEQAQRARRDYEGSSIVESLQRDVQELKAQLAEEKAQANIEQRTSAYLGQAVAAVDDSTPIVKVMVSKSPERARERLKEVALYLAEQNGEDPTPKEVAQALEKVRRYEIIEEGGDPDAFLVKPKPVNGEKRVGKTLNNDLTIPTPSRAGGPKTLEEERAETLRNLEEGRLD